MPLNPKTTVGDPQTEPESGSEHDRALGGFARRLARLTPQAGHDMRGRLHTIGLNLQLLDTTTEGEWTAETSSRVKRYAGVMSAEHKRLGLLLESLLRLMRFSGETVETFDLRQVLDDLQGFLATYAAARKIRLDVSPLSRLVALDWQRGALEQVLVDVALQLMEAADGGGSLAIGAEEQPDGSIIIRMAAHAPADGESAIAARGAASDWSLVRLVVETGGGNFEEADSGSSGRMGVILRLPRRSASRS